LNPSGSAQIGSGPWSGTYNGTLGILAPPSLTIGSGAATISGVVGLNVLGLGLTNNNGYFSQTLGQTYAANATYTLSADVNAGATLSLGLLQSRNVGIALTSNGSDVASTSTAGAGLVTLTPLGSNNYTLQLTFTTGSTPPTGNIGIRLFDQPTGLLTANLFPSATFDNITLTAVPEPTSVGLLGIGLVGLCFATKRYRRPAVA
ncbi:PEP-CTERM sorting domain-containing protein, partial [Singulisphaera rosea]